MTAAGILQSLEHLMHDYPLEPCWREPDLFSEIALVNGVEIHLVGLSARSAFDEVVSGSAASLAAPPLSRAYFELVERTSIVAMERAERASWPLRDEKGARRGAAGAEAIAPRSPDPDRWRYARSNGVALGKSWPEACEGALCELLERDHVLRSWYGEQPPTPVDLPLGWVPIGLQELYGFEAYSFETPGREPMVHVTGIFGFPKTDAAPLIYGFGARRTRADALMCSYGECLQRLGFLWGEQIPSSEPAMSPTPDFHQELFLWPATHDRIRRWLAGKNRTAEPIVPPLVPDQPDRLFAELTPPNLASRLFVAKALPQTELPLVFGFGHPGALRGIPDALQVHPIA
jgi:hypothetical protein